MKIKQIAKIIIINLVVAIGFNLGLNILVYETPKTIQSFAFETAVLTVTFTFLDIAWKIGSNILDRFL